ncbi:MAG TPA: C40 family peptidase [Burkholderiales bacterium]|nr:C40 family peptidase [Burkholderiales bacterium]
MDCVTRHPSLVTACMRLALLAAAALVLLALGGCSSTRHPVPEADRSATRPGGGTQGEMQRAGARAADGDVGASAAQNALAMRGKPYRYGGYSPQGFDCSGLVHYSYARAGGSLPRNTNGLWTRSRAIDRGEIRPGDLLFFHQDGKRNSHVAIYIGSNRFVHAPSSGKQVSTASLSDPYWRQHFSAARRPVL